MSAEIVLDDLEQAVAQRLARLRYESNRKHGVVDAKVGDQSNHQTDLEGIGAEIAFCKLMNTTPDLSVRPRKGGCDTEWLGLRTDVKQTRYETGRLLAVKSKRLDDAEVYVLMIGTFPTYRFAGWAFANDLLQPENLIDLGHGETYALPQERLRRTK